MSERGQTMARRTRMRMTRADSVFSALNTLLMVVVIICSVYPLWYCIILSFSNLNIVSIYEIRFWPVEFNLKNYEQVFKDVQLLNSFRVSIARTVVGASSHVFCCSMAAFALARREMLFNKFFTSMLLVTMFFSGGMIPTYIVLNAMKLTNNFWGYILPALYGGFDIILLRTFFKGIPNEIRESAMIDGAGDARIFFQFTLPLSKAVLATIMLFSAVYHWNDWFQGDFLMRDEKLYPLSTILMRVITRGQSIGGGNMGADASIPTLASKPTPTGIKMATVVIAVLPIMCVYPFLQKYFAKGIMLGSVKG